MTNEKASTVGAQRDRFETGVRSRSVPGWPCLIMALAIAGCSGGDSTPPSDDPEDQGNGGSGSQGNGGSSNVIPDGPFTADPSFFAANTVSQRVTLPLAPQGALLRAEALANQLAGYDPGSLLRCQLSEQAAYDAAIDTLGGVRWGYGVAALEDLSKPRFLAGFQDYNRTLYPATAGNATDGAPAPVEIALPDIVAVTESAALFYSSAHGLLLVNLSGAEPRFECATPLPGRVDQFYFHQGQLVAMIQANGTQNSFLLHFGVNGAELRFVEAVDLGPVNILDSRRFNDDLVFYTDLRLNAPATPAQPPVTNGLPNLVAPAPTPMVQPQHRALRVFGIGEALVEEMNDTLLDTTPPTEQLAIEGVTPETALDTLINESRRFGQGMWASDRYFVVTEEISNTYLSGWRSYTYEMCTQSHTVESPYTHCWTEYETRPNPDYVPPDNSGGDRSCQGTTLSACLTAVARVSNQTIQVPIGKRCEERVRYDWVCDAREQRTVQYPEFRDERATHLFIYEYTTSGFVRVDSSVHEITTPGLAAESPDAEVATLTTSTETFELSVPGAIQTLYFQNGFLYVISEGVLQVYAMGGSSIVRTSTLPVVNDSLQSTLFSGNRLYLSDFGWNGGGDRSTLRVVNLDNPAFPSVEANTHSLPGGHRSIIASDYGIFTIGSVAQFEGQAINAIKLGLFSDPFVEERAYLILGTDLEGAWLAPEEAQFFNGRGQRALLPYSGRDASNHSLFRVGVSHIEADQIVSEGAVVVPELPQRVRALGGATESYLSFSTNSIEWLTPNAPEWQTTPVLEYFQPTSVYRLNEANDYVEIQRLGDRCKLFFANASNINQRDTGSYSEAFACFGAGVTAFGNVLLFAEIGIEFDANVQSFRLLDQTEVAETRARIAERPFCLLSLELVDDTRVDYDDMPENAEVTCMSPVEYQERLNALIGAQGAP